MLNYLCNISQNFPELCKVIILFNHQWIFLSVVCEEENKTKQTGSNFLCFNAGFRCVLTTERRNLVFGIVDEEMSP